MAACALLAACGGPGQAQTPGSPASPSCSPAPRASFSPQPNPGAPRTAPTGPGSRQLVAGTVVSYRSGSLVVKDRRTNESVTIAVDASTQVREVTRPPSPQAAASPAPSGVRRSAAAVNATPVPATNLRAGQAVNVTASVRQDGSLLATAVVIQSGCGSPVRGPAG